MAKMTAAARDSPWLSALPESSSPEDILGADIVYWTIYSGRWKSVFVDQCYRMLLLFANDTIWYRTKGSSPPSNIFVLSTDNAR